MHISEGVLSGPVLITGAVLTVAGASAGIKKLDYENIAKAGLLSASFFVGSLIHVPAGPFSVHLILTGIIGLLLRWAAFPVIMTSLVLQGVFFQFGGITTLGVNTLIMAGPAVICSYIFTPFIWKKKWISLTASFCCGFTAVLIGALLLALSLIFTEENFFTVAKLALLAHIPVMIIEGIITLFCVSFLKKTQPSMLPNYQYEMDM